MPYNPDHDRLEDPTQLLEFIGRHPLATLVTHDGEGRPDADLIPLLCVRDASAPSGFTLVGHVARANPLWHEHSHDGTSLAVFGPAEHYVSPTWYPSKAEHHRVVPTWNYLVVHAWGPLMIHDDTRWVRGVVGRLTSAMEQGREEPWRMGQAPKDYLEEMLKQIVGIEVPVERLEGRFKVSAHRSEADRLGARDGVAHEARGRASDELAAAMTAVGPEVPERRAGAERPEGDADVPRVAGADFERWRSVGCGVESLHHLLTACGVEASLDDVLARALSYDGYDEDLGWRHRALVATAQDYGIPGEVRGDLTVDDFGDGLWLVSVLAPEQFESTHLVAVRAIPGSVDEVRIFWPQGQLHHGERFTVPVSWLAPRLTGRGMRFEAQLARS